MCVSAPSLDPQSASKFDPWLEVTIINEINRLIGTLGGQRWRPIVYRDELEKPRIINWVTVIRPGSKLDAESQRGDGVAVTA